MAMVRRRTASFVKTAACLFGLTFLWLQLNVTDLSDQGEGGSTKVAGAGGGGGATGASSEAEQGVNASALAALAAMNVPKALHKFLTAKPRNGSEVGEAPSPTPRPLSILEIRQNIQLANEQQAIINEDLFGPLNNDTIVIVVQVHTRINYLRHLIVSLAQARSIESALLVFSHDFYDEPINELIRSIDFCKVIQIFYPFSIQTHVNEFPGQSPNDCPRDIKKEQAAIKKCTNAGYPDLYGHYREAKFTQTKHHWWWKANRVFDQLEVTRNHSGLVLFLEEDHYVAEDFITVLRLMDRTRRASCDRCNILSLGTYMKSHNYYADSKKRGGTKGSWPTLVSTSWAFSSLLPSLYQHFHKAEITPWISSKHNMGMSFNRDTWREIKRCAEFFCTYDDYNWDWSLQHISQSCLKHKFHAMVMKGPRVFHIGECGVHHKKKNCESTAVVVKVQSLLRSAAKYLFPARLMLVQVTPNKKLKLRKGNGGWGDRRDHILCLNMTMPHTPPPHR